MKNLIWYSESAENYLSLVSHQILPSPTSSGSNFYLKMAYFDPKNMGIFMVFRDFQPNYWSYTTKSWQVNGPKVYLDVAEDCTPICPSLSYFGSKMAKIAKMTLKINIGWSKIVIDLLAHTFLFFCSIFFSRI